MKNEIRIDRGMSRKETPIISNAHNQYLWMGDEKGACFGTVTRVPQLRKIMEWCETILAKRGAKKRLTRKRKATK